MLKWRCRTFNNKCINLSLQSSYLVTRYYVFSATNMSVFKGIKGTFQSVQQDIVDGFKALTSFESQPKSEILKRLRGDGVKLDAGADLLYKYHLVFTEVDTYTKESAKRAEVVDSNISKIFKQWNNQDVLMNHLESSVKQLPVLVEVLNSLTTSLDNLKDDFQVVEEALEKLEDVCEEQELVKQKLHHTQQLQFYKQQRAKEIEKVKVQVARDHAERMIEIDKSNSLKLQERHEAFDVAFSDDLSFYKQHGHADKLALTDLPKVNSLSEITIDADDNALNDFLSSQTTTPIAEQPVQLGDNEGESNEKSDEESENEIQGDDGTFIEDDYTIDYGNNVQKQNIHQVQLESSDEGIQLENVRIQPENVLKDTDKLEQSHSDTDNMPDIVITNNNLDNYKLVDSKDLDENEFSDEREFSNQSANNVNKVNIHKDETKLPKEDDLKGNDSEDPNQTTSNIPESEDQESDSSPEKGQTK